MKTSLFLKQIILCVTLVLSCATLWATQYCNTPLTSGTNTIYLSCQMLSEGNYQIKIEGTGLTGLGGSFCNVNGVGGYQLNAEGHSVVSADNTTITCDITSSSAPNLYTPLYVLMPGEVVFTWPGDIEWGLCGSGVTDNEAPVMVSATLVSNTHNSAVISVSATDNIGVTKYIVTDAANAFNAEFTAIDGKITVTGLTSGTNYNLTITAKDATGNISANSKSVSCTTGTLTYCDFATGHLGNANFGDPNGRILLTIQKESSSSVSVSIKPNNESSIIDFMYVVLNGNALSLGAEDGTSIVGQKIIFTELTSLASLTFAPIQWHTTSLGTGGRWSVDNLVVAESELYTFGTNLNPISTMKKTFVEIYPNPVVKSMNLSADTEIAHIEICNLLGQKVMEQTVKATSVTIPMENLAVGNYFVTCTLFNGQKQVQKIIKR